MKTLDDVYNDIRSESEIFSICSECAKIIYIGDNYFRIDGFDYCSDCAHSHFGKIAGDECNNDDT